MRVNASRAAHSPAVNSQCDIVTMSCGSTANENAFKV